MCSLNAQKANDDRKDRVCTCSPVPAIAGTITSVTKEQKDLVHQRYLSFCDRAYSTVVSINWIFEVDILVTKHLDPECLKL